MNSLTALLTPKFDLLTFHGAGIPRVVLKGGRARLFRDGAPLIYSGAVDRVESRPAPAPGPGALVAVADGAKNILGWGVWNPTSMFRVRQVHRGHWPGQPHALMPFSCHAAAAHADYKSQSAF